MLELYFGHLYYPLCKSFFYLVVFLQEFRMWDWTTECFLLDGFDDSFLLFGSQSFDYLIDFRAYWHCFKMFICGLGTFI